MKLENIKNILFDFGGIIIDLDLDKAISGFESLGIRGFSSKKNLAMNGSLFENFERGLINEADFRNEMRKLANKKLSDHEIDIAWNSLLIGIPASRIDLLNQLKNDYGLYLLSNSNTIHYKYYSKQLFDDHQVTFDDLFVQSFFSFNLKLFKPDIEIYQEVEKQANIVPQETVFIDDNPVNLEAAVKAGFHVLHSPQDIDISITLKEAGLI
jgi:putative hydrolase of the HAD superfamily